MLFKAEENIPPSSLFSFLYLLSGDFLYYFTWN
jgi:hypothetical protein